MDSTPQGEPTVRQRVRIRFCKQGDLRLMGHRDLARLLERLFRRAGLALAHERRVSSETEDELSLRLGRGNRRARRSDGSGTRPDVQRRRRARAASRPRHARPRLPIRRRPPPGAQEAEGPARQRDLPDRDSRGPPRGCRGANRAASRLVRRAPMARRGREEPIDLRRLPGIAARWTRGCSRCGFESPNGPARDRATCWRRWDWTIWSRAARA